MNAKVIFSEKQFNLALERLSYQLIENHHDFSNSVIIGIQPRGIYVANRIKQILKSKHNVEATFGNLDVTFYRDDFRRREKPLLPSVNNIDFIIENKRVILVDDVLFTGRTVRAAMDAILAYGRPKEVELLAFIDRRFKRDLPITPNYIGWSADTFSNEKIEVQWKESNGEDKVILIEETDKKLEV